MEETLKKTFIIGGVVVLIGIIIVSSLFFGKKGKGKEVYTFEVEKGDIISSVSASGRIEPRVQVNISANVIGEIKELAVKEGSTLKKDDFLLQIDKDRYLSEVERLEAYLRMSKISVEREKVNLKNIENDLRRMKALHEERIVSDDELEKAQLRCDTQKIYLKSLDEQVAQAEADLEKAKDELKKTRITSPIDGIVTQLNSEAGEQVLIGTMNNPGTVIMVISDMSEILAEVDVDETEIVSVEKGQSAEIGVDAIGDKHTYEGTVEEIGNTAWRKGEVNSFAVKLKIVDPDDRLKPGMTARANIETERQDDVLKVPIQAVVQRDVEKEKKKAKEKKDRKKGKQKKEAERSDEQVKEEEKEERTTESIDKKVVDTDSLERVSHNEETSGESKTEEQKSADENDTKRKKEKEQDVVYLMIDGKAAVTLVETGLSDEFYVEIKSGLKEGDIVVTGPYRTLKNLKEGDAINKKEEQTGEKEGEEEKEEEEQS